MQSEIMVPSQNNFLHHLSRRHKEEKNTLSSKKIGTIYCCFESCLSTPEIQLSLFNINMRAFYYQHIVVSSFHQKEFSLMIRQGHPTTVFWEMI